MSREHHLAAAFVDLADTLVSDYDVADLMHRLVQHAVGLLDVSQVGLLLSDQRGGLRVMASSTEETKLLELFQIQSQDGPCLDCYRTGRPVGVADLARHHGRWPLFAPAAIETGFRAVHTFPMRLRERTVGALNLFNTAVGALSEDDGHIAQGLADIATIGLLHERALHESSVLVTQLEGALSSRVIIEQAKGVLAEQEAVSIDEAFQLLRSQARNSNRRLADVARDVVSAVHAPGARDQVGGAPAETGSPGAGSEPARGGPTSLGHVRRVLVAEDDADMRELIAQCLTIGDGYEITAVTDGPAALDALRDDDYDLAILDVVMPGLTGIQVTEAVRAHPQNSAVPIVLLSAHAGAAAVAAGLDAGATVYLTKPFGVAALRQLASELTAINR